MGNRQTLYALTRRLRTDIIEGVQANLPTLASLDQREGPMSDATSVLLSIYLVMYIIVALVVVFAVLYLVFKVRGFVRHLNERVNPLLKRMEDTVSKATATAHHVADRAQHTADTVTGQVEQIASTARATADHVARRVESTADLIRDTVASPVIGVNSVLAGVRKAAELLRERWTRRSED